MNQNTLPFLPPRSRRTDSPNKRGRANTVGDDTNRDPQPDLPTLPPSLPTRTNAPPLKPTNSFMFKGLKPLYTREIINNKPALMLVRYGQPGCDFKLKETNRVLSGTNNWKPHYRKYHPLIATSERDLIEQIKARQTRLDGSSRTIFEKPAEQQTHNERFRILLLE